MKTINKNFKVYSIIIILVVYVFAKGSINLADSDNLLAKNNLSNIHFLLAKSLSWFPAIPIIINFFFLFYFVKLSNNFKFSNGILLVLNPFMIVNVFDAFNRFSLSLFIASLAALYIKNIRLLLIIILGLMHPFYMLLFLGSKNIYATLLRSFILLIIWTAGYDYIGLLFPEKIELLNKLGQDIASNYEGNYKLENLNPIFYIDNIGIDPFSIFRPFLFPYFMESPHIADFLLSGLLSLGIISLFRKLLRSMQYGYILSLLITIGIVSHIVGNVAVMYRHMIPIFSFYYLISLSNKRLPQVPLFHKNNQ